MTSNSFRWYFAALLLASLLLAACGGGGSQGTLGSGNDRGFSLSSDTSSDGGTARLSLDVVEGEDSTVVNIMATDASGLHDLLLHLGYDAGLYNPAGQNAAEAMGNSADLLSLAYDQEPGMLHFAVSRIRGSGEGFSGNGIVASLEFEHRPFVSSRQPSSPPALGNAAMEISYNNLTGQLSWFYANSGDTNQDGLVNLSDLVPIARDYLANGPFSTSSRQSVADTNGDGEVNISDVSVLGANWNNDAFGGFNVYTSEVDGVGSTPVGNVAFSEAAGDPAGERLRFSYTVPVGSRLPYAWVQPVDGSGSAGLSGDAVFADIVISGPTASFGSKTAGGDGTADNPFIVNNSDSMPFAVYDPEDGDITLDPGLSVWLEPGIAGTVANGMLRVSDTYNGSFALRGSYQNQAMQLLAESKSASELGGGGGDGAFFDIDGCLQLHLDSPELEGNGSIWNPYKVTEAGETLDFSVWHCELGDVSDSEHLSWGWQPENAGEFGWDLKKFTFFQDFTGLWVIEVQWEHEGAVASDHLYFIVDPQGGGGEAELVLKVPEGYVDGNGSGEHPYIICADTHEFPVKAWHSELGDVTQSEHLIWIVSPETAGQVHPEWHQFNVAEGFLGNFYIEIKWESSGGMLSDRKHFKVQKCEPSEKAFEIKVGEGISGGAGTQENPYKVCINEVWEFGIKAWHQEFGDVTNHAGTTWSWAPEHAGQVHPEWHQFNMAEGFTGNFSIHAVHVREGGAWEDTKYFKALACENPEAYVEIKVGEAMLDGNGSQEDPWIVCDDTLEFFVKGWHSVLGDITQSELTTWLVDPGAAGTMHPEWHQFNRNPEFFGKWAIVLKYGEGEGQLQDVKWFKVIECGEEPYLALETDLNAQAGNGSQEAPFKFCQGEVGEIFFEVWHSELGDITYNEHLSWSWEPENAGQFRPDFSDFVVNPEYLGVFSVTCKYQTETQTLTKTLWFKQVECEFPPDLVLVVTNPPEQGEGTEGNPYIYLENPIEIGLKFLHPELGDITDNENVIWNWNPENAGEFRPQWNDFRVNADFTGGFWISAGWPTEGGTETRYVFIQIGNP